MRALHPNVRFHGSGVGQRSFLDDALAGLSAARKWLPPKYFYDARGSELFEAICALPEYYLTRTELAILRAEIADIAAALGPGCALIEYGSGTGVKTRLLIDALAPVAYVPIDISPEPLAAAANAIGADHPGLPVQALVADYTAALELPELASCRPRRCAVYFPGSTIGNFTPAAALDFLVRARAVCGPGGALLIGADTKKDRALIEAAYDDAQGVTAEFNLNLLERMNRELGADFVRQRFRHRAFYDPLAGRVEMHLESTVAQTVTIAGCAFRFAAGETIHTENSYKYAIEEFRALAGRAGFEPRRVWTDARGWFSVHYLEA